MTKLSVPIAVKRADFIGAAASSGRLPPEEAPEVAVVGRSNVGKSTLINRLTGRRKLARTSATPGRTQELNFFRVTLALGERELQLVLVDLPGFGFARVSKGKREALGRLTVDYLSSRGALCAVCLLNDCRRMPERDELAVRNLVSQREKRLLVVLTTADKLNQSERAKHPRAVAEAYGLAPQDVICTGERINPAPLWERIALLLE